MYQILHVPKGEDSLLSAVVLSALLPNLLDDISFSKLFKAFFSEGPASLEMGNLREDLKRYPNNQWALFRRLIQDYLVPVMGETGNSFQAKITKLETLTGLPILIYKSLFPQPVYEKCEDSQLPETVVERSILIIQVHGHYQALILTERLPSVFLKRDFSAPSETTPIQRFQREDARSRLQGLAQEFIGQAERLSKAIGIRKLPEQVLDIEIISTDLIVGIPEASDFTGLRSKVDKFHPNKSYLTHELNEESRELEKIRCTLVEFIQVAWKQPLLTLSEDAAIAYRNALTTASECLAEDRIQKAQDVLDEQFNQSVFNRMIRKRRLQPEEYAIAHYYRATAEQLHEKPNYPNAIKEYKLALQDARTARALFLERMAICKMVQLLDNEIKMLNMEIENLTASSSLEMITERRKRNLSILKNKTKALTLREKERAEALQALTRSFPDSVKHFYWQIFRTIARVITGFSQRELSEETEQAFHSLSTFSQLHWLNYLPNQGGSLIRTFTHITRIMVLVFNQITDRNSLVPLTEIQRDVQEKSEEAAVALNEFEGAHYGVLDSSLQSAIETIKSHLRNLTLLLEPNPESSFSCRLLEELFRGFKHSRLYITHLDSLKKWLEAILMPGSPLLYLTPSPEGDTLLHFLLRFPQGAHWASEIQEAAKALAHFRHDANRNEKSVFDLVVHQDPHNILPILLCADFEEFFGGTDTTLSFWLSEITSSPERFLEFTFPKGDTVLHRLNRFPLDATLTSSLQDAVKALSPLSFVRNRNLETPLTLFRRRDVHRASALLQSTNFIDYGNTLEPVRIFLDTVERDPTVTSHFLILEGSPGTGKTLTVRRYLREAGYIIHEWALGNERDRLVGGILVRLNEFFQVEDSAQGKPIVLFMDGIDAFCPQTKDGPVDPNYHDKNQEIRALQAHISSLCNRRVVLIGATNNFAALNSTIRDCGTRVHFSLPTSSERKKLLQALLADKRIELTLIEEIAEFTAGWSPRQLATLLQPIREELITSDRVKEEFDKSLASEDFRERFPGAQLLLPKFRQSRSPDPLARCLTLDPALREAIENLDLSTEFPKYYEKHRMHTLLYGPPGVGKTESLKTFAQNVNVPFISIDPKVEFPKIEAIFEIAKTFLSCLVFFDEIHFTLQHSPPLAGFLQTEMEGISKSSLTIIGATNYPDKIPRPLLDRFKNKAKVSLPDHTVRATIFYNLLSAQPVEQMDSTLKTEYESHLCRNLGILSAGLAPRLIKESVELIFIHARAKGEKAHSARVVKLRQLVLDIQKKQEAVQLPLVPLPEELRIIRLSPSVAEHRGYHAPGVPVPPEIPVKTEDEGWVNVNQTSSHIFL